MVEKFHSDPSIIQTHPVLGGFVDRLECIADVIERESVVHPNTEERSYWHPCDTYANSLLRTKNVMCLHGDPIIQQLSPGGKEVDVFIGAVAGVCRKLLLAIECKLKVGYGTCADIDFYRDLEAKFDHAKLVIKELPTAFFPKMIVLMCRKNAAVCRRNLSHFQLQYKMLATFSCLECLSVENLNDALI